MAEFLGTNIGSFPFRLNVARVVVTAMVEKLAAIAFDVRSDRAVDGSTISFAQDTWEANSMDALQADVYEAMLRDGEHFVLVDWPADAEYARWLPQIRYTDLSVDEAGGEGCWMAYPNNDINQKALYGVKQWTEWGDDGQIALQRRTIYYEDRVEKFAREGMFGDWAHYQDENDTAWPIPWVDNEGLPLGIPLIHFKNKGLRQEADDAIPLQDAINKSTLDLLETADQTAYRIYVALGFIPTTDGQDLADDDSNRLDIRPGIVVGTTKNKNEADFSAIDPGDLSPLMNLVQQAIMWLALVSDTPISRFLTTKLIASDETLKEQEAPLNAKIENRQQIIARGWIDCLALSWKLAVLYQPLGMKIPLEKPRYKVIWKDPRGLSDRLEELIQKQKLNVPDEQIWSEMGYSQDKIVTWTAAKELAAKQLMQSNPAKVDGQTVEGDTNAIDSAATGESNMTKETSNASTKD